MEKNLGHATAYGYAKSKGYSGTEDEFAQLMADYASVGQSAAQSAEQAAASATSASGSATTASQAAQAATSKASEAVTAAGTATTKASEASQSATSASQSAESAGTSAQTATTAATTATTKASEASESATTATAAKTDAETARDAAAQSASEAAQSAASIDPDEFDRKIYAAFATDTATGSIASFPDGADSIPMKDVLVHVDPVQDLHGYDHPWPAGGGVNKFDIDNIKNVSGAYGLTTSIDGDIVRISGTYTRTSGVSVYRIIYHDQPIIEDAKFAIFRLDTNSEIISLKYASTPDNSIVVEIRNMTPNTDVDVRFRFMLYTGSTVPTSYTPYSNICPITGWTGAKVTRTGKNLYSRDNGQYNVPVYAMDGTASAYVDVNVVWIKVNPNTRYTIVNKPNSKTYCVRWIECDENKEYVWRDSNMTPSVPSRAYTTRANTHYLQIAVNQYVTDEIAKNDWEICIQEGTDTKYHPYSGQTYDITFPSEAGTVYGGLLDVTTGVLTVDRAIIASYAGEILPSTWISDRDVYSEGATPTTGAQVCYELATPITYQLTPQEITSLLGTNNLWADTGDSDVEYRADTKMYIARQIADAVSALS